MTPVNRHLGFTLIELVIVIMILGVLAGIAAPKLLDVAGQAAVQAVIADVDGIMRAIEIYHAETGAWPANVPEGVMPPDLEGYIDRGVFSKTTAIGGVYDWNGPGTSMPSIGVAVAFGDGASYQEIDQLVDDGDLGAGLVTLVGSSYLHFELAPK